MSVVTRLIAFPFLAAATVITGAWLLFWALIGPVLVGLGAHWLLNPGSTGYSVVMAVGVVWGAFGLWHWWLHVRVLLAALFRVPARGRRRRR